MFEKKSDPVLPAGQFVQRLSRHVLIAAGVLAASLLAGTWGYHVLDNLPWIDALLNASMILAGMGPVDALHTDAAKLFASAYAIYSGSVVLVVLGIVLAPVAHRLLHQFHADDDDS